MGSTVYEMYQAVVLEPIETIYTPTTVLAQKPIAKVRKPVSADHHVQTI